MTHRDHNVERGEDADDDAENRRDIGPQQDCGEAEEDREDRARQQSSNAVLPARPGIERLLERRAAA